MAVRIYLSFTLIAALFLILSYRAFGQTGSESQPLSWQVAAQCGSNDDVTEGVTQILGNNSFAAALAVNMKLHGEIARQGQKWRVQLRVIQGPVEYERSLRVNTCHGAMEAAILLSALAVDFQKIMQSNDPAITDRVDRLTQAPPSEDETTLGDAASSGSGTRMESPIENNTRKVATEKTGVPQAVKQPSPVEGETGKNDASQTDESPTQSPRKTDAKAGKGNLRGTLGGGLVLNNGLLASFRAGITVRGSVHRRFWMLSMQVQYLPPVSSETAHAGLKTTWKSQAFGSMLTAGHQYTFGRLRPGWALGLGVLGFRARAQDVSFTDTNAAWVGAGVLNGHLAWQLSNRFGVLLATSAMILFARPKFLVRGRGVIHQVDRVGADVSIGFFYIF